MGIRTSIGEVTWRWDEVVWLHAVSPTQFALTDRVVRPCDADVSSVAGTMVPGDDGHGS